MLRMNGRAILNWLDLRQYFDPWEADRQLEEFCSFAGVHCVPLPFVIPSPEGGFYKGEYLTKELWRQILTADIEIDKRASWEEYERALMRQTELVSEEDFGLDEEDTGKEEREENDSVKAVRREMKDAGISAKIKSIQEALRQEESAAGHHVLRFLALCMIAEVDPGKVDFIRKKKRKPEKEKKAEGYASDFPTAPVVKLSARSDPYRYWLYEKELMPGAFIETVRIEAERSKNEFERVTIELYSKTEEKMVWKFTLEKGEYRHCNVVQGKIVKFLPTLSISEKNGMFRPQYGSSNLMICGANGESRTMEMDKEVSGFACSKDGELLLRDGKVMPYFYQPYVRDCFVKSAFDSFMDRFVEVCLSQKRYLLLTEEGVIRSNDPTVNGKRGVVSLDGKQWMRQLEGISMIREFAIDEKGECLICHSAKREECKVYWKGRATIQPIGERTWKVGITGEAWQWSQGK